MPESHRRPVGDSRAGQSIVPRWHKNHVCNVLNHKTLYPSCSKRTAFPQPVDNSCFVSVGNRAGIYVNCVLDGMLFVDTASTVSLLHCGLLGHSKRVSRLPNRTVTMSTVSGAHVVMEACRTVRVNIGAQTYSLDFFVGNIEEDTSMSWTYWSWTF